MFVMIPEVFKMGKNDKIRKLWEKAIRGKEA